MRKNNMKTIEEKLEMINRYKSGESATKIVKENAINKRRTNWESNYFAYRPRFCLFKYKTIIISLMILISKDQWAKLVLQRIIQ